MTPPPENPSVKSAELILNRMGWRAVVADIDERIKNKEAAMRKNLLERYQLRRERAEIQKLLDGMDNIIDSK